MNEDTKVEAQALKPNVVDREGRLLTQEVLSDLKGKTFAVKASDGTIVGEATMDDKGRANITMLNSPDAKKILEALDKPGQGIGASAIGAAPKTPTYIPKLRGNDARRAMSRPPAFRSGKRCSARGCFRLATHGMCLMLAPVGAAPDSELVASDPIGYGCPDHPGCGHAPTIKVSEVPDWPRIFKQFQKGFKAAPDPARMQLHIFPLEGTTADAAKK